MTIDTLLLTDADHAALRQWCFNRAESLLGSLDERIKVAEQIEAYLVSARRLEGCQFSDGNPTPSRAPTVDCQRDFIDQSEDMLAVNRRCCLAAAGFAAKNIINQAVDDAFAGGTDVGHEESPVSASTTSTVDGAGAADKAAPKLREISVPQFAADALRGPIFKLGGHVVSFRTCGDTVIVECIP